MIDIEKSIISRTVGAWQSRLRRTSQLFPPEHTRRCPYYGACSRRCRWCRCLGV